MAGFGAYIAIVGVVHSPQKRGKHGNTRSIFGYFLRPWSDFAIFCVAVTLGVATVAGATAARRPAATTALKNVRILGDLSLFSDPQVQRELRASGWNVTSHGLGATVIVTHLPQAVSGYQVVYLPNQIQGRLVQDRLSSLGMSNNSIAPYSSRLAVATYLPVAKLLASPGIGLATQRADGTWLFNLEKYVNAVNSGLRWADIAGEASRNSGPVLLSTTDPHVSALAQEFVALAGYALNGNRLVTDQVTARRVNRQLRAVFTEQGGMLTGATEAFSSLYVGGDKYTDPLTLTYENLFLQREMAAGPSPAKTAPQDKRVLMYLNPEAVSKNTLVALGNPGWAVSQLLNNPPITDIAQNKYGFITSAGVTAFAAAMKSHGLQVPGPELTTDTQFPVQSIMTTLLAGLP